MRSISKVTYEFDGGYTLVEYPTMEFAVFRFGQYLTSGKWGFDPEEMDKMDAHRIASDDNGNFLARAIYKETLWERVIKSVSNK